MMKLKNIPIACLSFVLGACGASPLLNHQNADDLKVQSSSPLKDACAVLMSKSARCFKVSWLRGPFNDRESILVVNQHSLNTDGSPGPIASLAAGEALELDPQMPSMGHGSYENAVVQNLADGLFLGKKIVFSMEGEWELNFILKLNGVEVDRAVLPVKIL